MIVIRLGWDDFKYLSDSKGLQKFFVDGEVDVTIFVIGDGAVIYYRVSKDVIDNELAFSQNYLYDAIRVLGVSDSLRDEVSVVVDEFKEG